MKPSLRYVVVLAMSVAVAGALQQIFYANSDAANIVALVMFFPQIILLRLWVGADAAERGITIPTGAAIVVPLLAIVGVPYYLLRSRAHRVALWQVPLAIVFMIAISYLGWAGQLLVYAVQTH
jgi:hypothetical protein